MTGGTEGPSAALESGTVTSSGIYRCVVRWKSTNVSQKHVVSIFRVEEYAKQETSMKQVKRRTNMVVGAFQNQIISVGGHCRQSLH
jgi:hypothetical protein